MSNLRKILSNKISCKSIWFMRQAVDTYRNLEISDKNPNFIKLAWIVNCVLKLLFNL